MGIALKLTRPSIGDINAGFLVALVGIPQCLAYAMLSGLPPMYGLVTAAIPGVVAAFLGRSAHVTVGPTNTTGLIILTSLAPWANSPELLLTAMATLAFLAGLSRLAIVLFKAERIFDFVPEAVMVGFATGAAIIIALMQIDEVLGTPFVGVLGVIDELYRLANYNWALFSPESFLLAMVALASVILGKRYLPKWPIPLVVLIVSIALVWFEAAPFVSQWVTLGDTTVIDDGWPRLAGQLPSWQMVQMLIIPGFAVAFIGSLELIVTLRNKNQQILLPAELKSQGIANIVGSAIGAFPASTSLTRSVLLDIGGATSRWAPFIAGLALLPIIFYGAEGIRSIPQPVIAGLLIATALSMVKPRAIKQMLRVNNQTRLLFLVTLGSTLILNFHEAILLGAAFGIVMFLFQSSSCQLYIQHVDPQGNLTAERSEQSIAQLIQVSGSLHFAAARQLPERISTAYGHEYTQLYIDLSHAHQCRIAAVQALTLIAEEAHLRGVRLQLVGASPMLKHLAKSMGIALPWSEHTIAMQLRGDNHEY